MYSAAIESIPIDLDMDCGVVRSFLSVEHWDMIPKLWRPEMNSSKTVLRIANGQKVGVLGEVILEVNRLGNPLGIPVKQLFSHSHSFSVVRCNTFSV